MKLVFAWLFCVVAIVSAAPPPLQRNEWTTNLPGADITTTVTITSPSNNVIGGVKAAYFHGNGSLLTGLNTLTNNVAFTNANRVAFAGHVGVTSNLNGTGASFSAPVLSTSSSASNSPSGNEFPTAQWVRGLFDATGSDYYVSTNIASFGTNDSSGQLLYVFQSDLCTNSGVRNYTSTEWIAAGNYLGSVVTTNTFSSLGGNVAINTWIGFSGGSGNPTVTLKPELYWSYDRTNWYGDYSGSYENIAWGQTNIYTWAMTYPMQSATNATGFYVQRRFKVGTLTGAGTPTLSILVGTNLQSGVGTASHVSMQSPTATAGNAYLANNQVFAGSNHFSAQITSETTNGATQLVRGDWLTNAVSTATNNSILRTNTVTAAGSGIVVRQDGAGGITLSNDTATSSNFVNLNAEQMIVTNKLIVNCASNPPSAMHVEGTNTYLLSLKNTGNGASAVLVSTNGSMSVGIVNPSSTGGRITAANSMIAPEFTASGSSPSLTLTDTTSGDDDCEIGGITDWLVIRNTTSSKTNIALYTDGDVMVWQSGFGAATGTNYGGIRWTNQPAGGVPKLAVTAQNGTGNCDLHVIGDIYAEGTISGLTVVDRSASPTNLSDAYAIVESMNSTADGKVDHAKLHVLAWSTKVVLVPTGQKLTNHIAAVVGDSGQELEPAKTVVVDVTRSEEQPDQSGRNLSMVISAQALVIKDLLKRIEAIEKSTP